MTIEKDIEVDVDLYDFEIDDIIEFLEDEGYTVKKKDEVVEDIPGNAERAIVSALHRHEDKTGFYREVFTQLFNIPFDTRSEDIVDKILNLI